MDEVDPETAQTAAPQSAGDMLKAARDAQGLSVAEVGARTRIPARHLEAIEKSDYTGLPSATYAVGFAKGYARAVGLDEVVIAQAVRADVDRLGRRVPEYEPYDVTDPARVPPRGVAIAGLGIALAVLVLVGLWYGTDWFRSPGVQREVPPTATAAVPAAPVAAPSPTAVAAQGQVRLTAGDEVWMRVYDADNTTLYLGTMKPGETFDVPPTANNPMINVGRPDKLAVSVNGSAVPALGTGERAIKDVGISAAALAARGTATAPSEERAETRDTDAGDRPRRSADRAERPRPPRRALSETQRANIDAAANPPPPADNASAR